MDPIKEAFHNVRQDMNTLDSEISSLKLEVQSLNQELMKICEILGEMTETLTKVSKNQEKIARKTSSKPSYTSAIEPKNETTPANIQTQNPAIQHLVPYKTPENKVFSTGNEGVPADRQTNQQTDTTLEFPLKMDENKVKLVPDPIDNAAKILDSLDGIRKEIRLKFKRLTDQEVLVFSTIYQLDEESTAHGGQGVEYKTVATRLNLTESSIRDYVVKLIKKGIPVDKTRINNKTILLSISKNLKKIAPLATILQLRDL